MAPFLHLSGEKISRIGPLDAVIICALSVISIAFVPAMQANEPATVIVRRDGGIVARYPLDRNVTFQVKGNRRAA